MIITSKNTHTFNQGDKVEFQISENVKGSGKIVGLSTTPITVIGQGYIVESTDGQFPSEHYPFTHFVIFESMILNHPNID